MAATNSTAANQWEEVYNEKRSLLEKALGSEVPSLDYDGFKAAMEDLARKHSASGLIRFIKKLDPHLNHVKSFTSAINSATQAGKISTLVWGGLWILIEIACRSSSYLNKMVIYIDKFHSELPMFDVHMALFPTEVCLQDHLRRMYRAYLDYCLTAMEYLKKKPFYNLLKLGFSSSQQQIMIKASNVMEAHRNTFYQEVEIIKTINSEEVRLQRARRIGALALPAVNLNSFNASPASSRSNVSWPVHAVDLPVNYSFHGREAILDQIHTFFFSTTPMLASKPPTKVVRNAMSKAGPDCCVLYGLGGIGKTSIARQYIYLYKDRYDAVFWLRAESESDLRDNSYPTIARKLKLVDENCVNSQAAEEAKNWLECTDKEWLLVFDNIGNVNDIHPYLPCNQKGHVIITSQNSQFVRITDGSQEQILITEFPDELGANALFKYLGRNAKSDDELETAKQISHTVGGLPLAIATIAGYVLDSAHELSDFLESFNQSSKFWSAGRFVTLGKYEKTLSTVFEVALQDLETPEPKELLKLLAFLNPDEIPEKLLRVNNPIEEQYFLADHDKAGFMDIVRQLQRRHLITRKPDADGAYSISIHRSLQWTILHNLNDNQAKRKLVFHGALDLVRRIVPEPDPLVIPEPDKWPVYQKYLPQVLSLAQKSAEPLPLIGMTLNFATLLCDVSSYMWYQGLIVDCNKTTALAEKILDEINFDKFSKLRWDLHIIRGILCTFTGVSKRKEGFEYRQKSLDICDHQEIGSSATDYTRTMRCISVADLAIAYLEDENFVKVEELMQECASLYEQLGTESELAFHWGRFYHHRSYGKSAEGNHLEALEMCQKAAALQESHSGVESTHTQDYRFSIAEMLYHAGDIIRSLKIHENVLEARIRLDGQFNHRTLTSHFIVGVLQWQKGNLEEAEKNMKTCLEKKKASHWSEEQRARASFYLSKLLQVKGNQNDADKYRAFAVEVKERLKKVHPQYLREEHGDERVAYDLMVPIQDFRLTGHVHGPSVPWW